MEGSVRERKTKRLTLFGQAAQDLGAALAAGAEDEREDGGAEGAEAPEPAEALERVRGAVAGSVHRHDTGSSTEASGHQDGRAAVLLEAAATPPAGAPFAYHELCVSKGWDPVDPGQGLPLKTECQDDGLLQHSFGATDEHSFLAVFDGHGRDGKKAANFCANNMASNILRHRRHLDRNPDSCFSRACGDMHSSLIRAGADMSMSGSTGVFVVHAHGKMFVGNVGDSRAVLCRSTPDGGVQAVDLSKDQKPEDPEERQRIEESGGEVRQVRDADGNLEGPYRVFAVKANYPGISMARSFGDTVAKKLGVTAAPVTSVFQPDPRDLFVLLASDGLWEYISSEEAVKFVHGRVLQPGYRGGVCAELAAQGQARWVADDPECIVDDTTVLVAWFKRPKTCTSLTGGKFDSLSDRPAFSEPKLEAPPPAIGLEPTIPSTSLPAQVTCEPDESDNEAYEPDDSWPLEPHTWALYRVQMPSLCSYPFCRNSIGLVKGSFAVAVHTTRVGEDGLNTCLFCAQLGCLPTNKIKLRKIAQKLPDIPLLHDKTPIAVHPNVGVLTAELQQELAGPRYLMGAAPA